ncbi:MAG: hypothetical protein H8E36_04870 [Rhodospirillaceae bacterium]|nr:hypothetical protein [Rhodospirillaceae bacterium]
MHKNRKHWFSAAVLFRPRRVRYEYVTNAPLKIDGVTFYYVHGHRMDV